jgi:hypothetical protein
VDRWPQGQPTHASADEARCQAHGQLGEEASALSLFGSTKELLFVVLLSVDKLLLLMVFLMI